MTERYSIVEDPDGAVSVAVNVEVKPQPCALSNPRYSHVRDNEMQHRPATILGDSPILMLSRRRGNFEPAQSQELKTYGLTLQMCAFILLLSAVVNVCVHKRLIDIINVVLTCFTSLAIRYDLGCLSKCQLLSHGTFAVGTTIPLALNSDIGQVVYQLGCMSLCIYCLMTK